MTDARADGACFDNSDLEYATLSGTDLTDASFQKAKLYTCQLVTARVGSDTDFDEIFDYLAGDQTEDTGGDHPGRKAASVYRSLEAVYRNNSLTDESLQYHRRRKNALLRVNWDERRSLSVGVDGFLKLTTGHGTELKRLVYSSGVFVAGTAIVHYAAGTIAHDELGVLSIANANTSLVGDVWQTLVFSLLAFTGLGYGRFTPTSTLGEALAVGQSAVGVLFFGLLVFVLSTRASR